MVKHIEKLVQDIKESDEKLVLIVGQPGSGKSKVMRDLSVTCDWEYIDARALVTAELLELMPEARTVEAPRLIANVFAKLESEVVLLDGVQALFAPVLRLDPLVLLRKLSRKYTIVAAWPGRLQDDKLIFDQDGRLSYRDYDAAGLNIVKLV